MKIEFLYSITKLNKLIINKNIQIKRNEIPLKNKSYLRVNSYLQNKLKKFFCFFRLIISFINLTSFFVKLNQESIKNKLSEVTLKVKGTGNIKITLI